MDQETSREALPAGESKHQTRMDSTKDAYHENKEALLFLNPETGTVVAVPVDEAPAFRSHYNRYADLIADYHSANAVVQVVQEDLQKAALAHAGMQSSPDMMALQDLLEAAYDWRDSTHDELLAEMKVLDALQDKGKPGEKKEEKSPKPALGSTGKKLVELIALQAGNRKGRREDEAKGKGPKFDGADLRDPSKYKIKINLAEFKSGSKDDKKSKLKHLYKYPKKPFEKVVYARNDKIKEAWRYKDKAATKWEDVKRHGYKGDKVADYVREQVRATDIKFWETGGEGSAVGWAPTLNAWTTKWNDKLHSEGKGAVTVGGHHIGDAEYDTKAQLFRYMYGASSSFNFDPKNGNVMFKAEGSAECDLVNAKAEGKIYLPAKDGWLWQMHDLNGKPQDVVTMRAMVGIELAGVVGASIAGSLAIGVQSQISEPPKATGQRGRKGKNARRKTASMNKKETDVGKLDVEVSVFAGAKADATLTGAFEWRDPESKSKEFAEVASIAPTIGAMAGLAGEAKFAVDYVNGVFHMVAHASLCFGVGCEGTIGFAVSPIQVEMFVKCIYYHMLNLEFRNAKIIGEAGIGALKNIGFLALKTGRQIEAFAGQAADALDRGVRQVIRDFEKADARYELACRISYENKTLKYMPPEGRGMVIYQLTRHSYADAALNPGAPVGDNYLKKQKQAVLIVLNLSQIRRELDNVIQHIHPQGHRGDLQENMRRLSEFFRTASPRDWLHTDTYQERYEQLRGSLSMSTIGQLDDLAMNGDFDGWYTSMHDWLRDSPLRGEPTVPANTVMYALNRDRDDHPLFSSSTMLAYYKDDNAGAGADYGDGTRMA